MRHCRYHVHVPLRVCPCGSTLLSVSVCSLPAFVRECILLSGAYHQLPRLMLPWTVRACMCTCRDGRTSSRRPSSTLSACSAGRSTASALSLRSQASTLLTDVNDFGIPTYVPDQPRYIHCPSYTLAPVCSAHSPYMSSARTLHN
jgi:hypothetical protein